MSHLKERKEKNCLNCNAQVHGRYCSICGQENIEPTETFWHLVTHFFNDITHFDGKFFSTLKLLVFKPGFLSTEYKIGRRASYLNPIRMYVFTSAVFFLIFFSLYDFKKTAINKTYDGFTEEAISKMDSASFRKFTYDLTDHKRVMTREEFRQYADSMKHTGGITLSSGQYKTREEYDSVLRTGVKKQNWLERTLTYKQIDINAKYNNDQSQILATLINILFHSFPQMLFIALPLFAWFLMLLYRRKHKDFHYVSHAIFTVHLYIFVFIMLLLLMAIDKLTGSHSYSLVNWLIFFIYLSIFFYEYKAMRNFYGQGRIKTFIKFILLNLWLLLVVTVLFVVFLFFSFLKV